MTPDDEAELYRLRRQTAELELRAAELRLQAAEADADERACAHSLYPDGVETDGRTVSIPKSKRAPQFDSARAGGSHDSKADRAGRMLVAYEQDKIRHVKGTHLVLEKALKRFLLVKPFDLVDAAYWAWNDLAGKPTRKRGTPISLESRSKWK